MTKMNIVVIGAGVSGLCSAKYALQSGHSVTVYEQTSSLGGTWVYTEATGVDEYGIDIHTSMYHGLRTILPKEIMVLNEYPMPTTLRESYIGSQKIQNYLEGYANHFNVVEKIKFRHQVIRVRPVQDTKWEIIVNDLLHDKVTTHIYDAIFVCNGHNNDPSYPIPPYPGTEIFQGKQIHSHSYRRAEEFEGKSVLIIGGGSSAIELPYMLSRTAKYVYISHRTHNYSHVYPPNVIRIDSVEELTETGVIIVDGSQHDVDEIIYCTGYKFTFPFMSIDCGLCADGNYIHPLFKDVININHPTMAIIGLPAVGAIAQMIDIQARFVMKFLNGEKSLPSVPEMKADIERYAEMRRAAGHSKRRPHILHTFQRNYYDELAGLADIENVREIYMKIYDDAFDRRMTAPNEYRDDIYHILDETKFERTTIVHADSSLK